MPTTISLWHLQGGASPILKLFTLSGSAVTPPDGVPLTEPEPVSVPGLYQANVDPELAPGTYRSRVFLGPALVDDGFLTIDPLTPTAATIDDFPKRLDTLVSALQPELSLTALTEEYSVGQHRFTSAALANAPAASGQPGSLVQVDGFTAQARQQLAGTTIAVQQPVWTAGSFSKPVVRGDSYTGGLAIQIDIAEWPGPDLTAAESILLTAVRLPARDSQFSWAGVPHSTADRTWLQWELTSLQTDQLPGLYSFDVEARWAGGIVHTLIGPDARLRIVQDQTV